MDLPTYTNIWRIEKRLYKLYDLRLPMPLPLVQIGVFVGVFVPWVLLLMLVGAPFRPPWHVLYLVPPGVVTWLATRPVIEGKRLTELLLSQARYLSEPRTWCRLTPIREPREVVVVARVWRRHDDRPASAAPAMAAATAPARAAVRAQRGTRPTRPAKGHPAVVPVHHAQPRPATAAAPAGDVKVAGRPAAPAPSTRVVRSWRRTMPRDVSHESDAPPPLSPAPRPSAEPDPTAVERPPATPRLETPPARPAGSSKRALASGIKRPGEAAEVWQAVDPAPQPPPSAPDTPDIPPAQPATPPTAGTGETAPSPPAVRPTAPDIPQQPERPPGRRTPVPLPQRPVPRRTRGRERLVTTLLSTRPPTSRRLRTRARPATGPAR